jgi:hypothetical protein
LPLYECPAVAGNPLQGGGNADRLLDEKLHSLAARNYLSEPEQLEEVTLKKRKLHLKDQMETIVRRHRTGEPSMMRG